MCGCGIHYTVTSAESVLLSLFENEVLLDALGLLQELHMYTTSAVILDSLSDSISCSSDL